MVSQDLKKFKLPDSPGVYKFYQGPKLLYIGKATSLRDRVRSYFAGDLGETRGPKIEQMLKLANKVDWQETDSVLEALLLESNLIKKYQPKYNSREKDDKSYWYVVITREDYPRVLPVRGRELYNLGIKSPKTLICSKSNFEQYGPFPYASEIKEALKIIRRIFPYRDTCLPRGEPQRVLRGCFNRQIGLCPGICTGEISKREYQKNIRNIKLLFSGKKQEIIKKLEREMRDLAKKQSFEKAGQIRDQIFALNHIRDVALLKNSEFGRSRISGSLEKRLLTNAQAGLEESPRGAISIRIEAYDIAHLSGKKTVGAMAVWQDGEIDRSAGRKFELRGGQSQQANDPANLREILGRRFNHPEWPWPDIVVVDGNQVQMRVAEGVISAVVRSRISGSLEKRLLTTVVGVVKDSKHKASKIIGDSKIIHDYHRAIIEINAEAHRLAISYHRKKMRQII
ncbi:MAG TPA: UvrB/UvrC motif-containing protein [Candidatus Paceibacterota bacterium]|nr:UvrB/UvrC motif-containing protein [Candidatus Paceibacterota bacterium]